MAACLQRLIRRYLRHHDSIPACVGTDRICWCFLLSRVAAPPCQEEKGTRSAPCSSHSPQQSAKFSECFRGTDLRRTLIGVAMSFFTISTGITFWFGYGTTFFAAAGVDDSYLISLVLAITNCVFTAPSMYLIERLGRRRSLIAGGILMGIAQLLTGIIHSAAPDSKADKMMLIVGAVFFIASYATTWGTGGKLSALKLCRRGID